MATRQHLDIAGRDDGATKKSIGAAGLGGASTGTGLVGLGQLIGSHTLVGEILIYVAPVFSVISGLLLSQLGYMVKIWVDRYNENSVVKKARGTLEGQLADPNLSEEHKDRIRGKLDELNLILANREISRVRAIKKPQA